MRTPSNPKSSRYFDFQLQEGDKEKRVVYISSDKQEQLKQKEQQRISVQVSKVSPQKRRYGGSEEYCMNKFSRVSPAINITFQWKQPANRCGRTIHQILDSNANGDLVEVLGKVLSKSDPETVFSNFMQKRLAKCQFVFANATAAVTLTLWEDHIKEVKQDASYRFEGLRVCFYNNKYLTGNKNTKIKECNAIKIPENVCTASKNLQENEKEKKEVNGSILLLNILKSYICVNCKSKIQSDSYKMALKCSSCNFLLRMGKTWGIFTVLIVETFRFDSEYDYEYEFWPRGVWNCWRCTRTRCRQIETFRCCKTSASFVLGSFSPQCFLRKIY